ncbi:MerR family transcriptional regulator [Halobacillus rhizosphaerae]|uniref:MerR family transcriptional regulator n=1 Tax=Halobacillus rhizosphaerae TaxID=3064889 RepID=UPI00398B151E
MAKTIKQAAEELRIPTDTIRYYDRVGLLPNLQRNQNGYRLFSDDDMYTLEMIKCFRATNMSIEDLTKIFAFQSNDSKVSLTERLRIISSQRENLLEQRKQIDEALALTDYKIKRYKEKLKN